MEEKFDVTGMTCAACQANVTRVVSKLDGVSHCDVSLLSNSMKVEFDQDKVNEQVICEAVKQIGYGASVHGEKGEVKKEWQNRQNRVESDQRSAKQRLILSLVLLIPLLVIAMGPMVGLPILEGMEWMMISALTQLILCLFILFIQRHFFITGFKALMKKSANMDSLVAMGSGASFVYGLVGIYQMAYYFGVQNIEMAHMAMHSLYFESAATIVTLVSVGKYLESRSKAKTSDALDKLVDLAPKNATILRDGKEVVVSSESIRIHDIVVIRPGQRIHVDGKVVKKGDKLWNLTYGEDGGMIIELKGNGKGIIRMIGSEDDEFEYTIENQKIIMINEGDSVEGNIKSNSIELKNWKTELLIFEKVG